MNNQTSFTDADVVILPHDSVYATIRCPRHIAYELSEQFVFKAENYRFHPKYKKKLWDGNIRLFPRGSDKLYIGLIDDVVRYCRKTGYSVYVHPELTNAGNHVKKDKIKQFLDGLNLHARGKPIQAKDYQIDAVWRAVNKRRMIVKSPTGSGKSLIIYSILRWFEQHTDQKQLVIVPTISLVTQMAADFADYSLGEVSDRIYSITGGVEKDVPDNKDIVITTWQSIAKQHPSWYDQFHTIIADEAHQYKATSLKTIMENARNTDVKIGTTGTTGKKLVNVMTLKALFGEIISFTSTKKLMDRKDLAQMEIHAFVLNYPAEMGKELRRQIREAKKDKANIRKKTTLGYNLELQMVYNSSIRMKFLCKVVKSAKKRNCLILFDRSEYGKDVYQTMKKVFPEKQVFYIDKDVKKAERESIRNYMEEHDDCVLVASYGTTATGVNIRNLPVVVLASPTKSVIRLLQSIGRGLRKHENKDKLLLVDIADNLSTKSQKNYGIKHFMDRLGIYSEEGFDFKIREVAA